MSIKQSCMLKAIAIIMVIISHLAGIFGIRYATPLGGIGVSIFLFVSGYGLNESYKIKKLKKFFVKRFSKVIIPYVMVVFITGLIEKNTFVKIIKNTLLLSTPNYMWFIQFIVINYIAFYIINRFINKKMNKYIIFSIMGTIFFFVGGALWAEQAYMFFIGVIVSDNKKAISEISKNKKIVLAIILLNIGIVALLVKQMEVVRNSPVLMYYSVELILKNCIAVGIIIIIVNTKIIIGFSENILLKIGDISYELYLIHAIVIMPILNDKNNITAVVLFIFTTVIGAIYFNKLLKYINKYLV